MRTFKMRCLMCMMQFYCITAFAQIDIISIENTLPNACTGSINIIAEGTAGPFTFQWVGPNNYSSTDEDIDGLCEGQYHVTVANAYGCDVYLSANVQNQCDVLTLTADVGNAHELLWCSNGFIDLHVNGGVGPFIYNWNIQEYPQDEGPQDLSDLNPGRYCVRVKDEYCGTESQQVCFTVICCLEQELQRIELELEAVVVHATEDGGCKNGSISLPTTGPGGPYTFDWGDYIRLYPGDVPPTALYDLGEGEYCVTVLTNDCEFAEFCYDINCCPPLPEIRSDCDRGVIHLDWTGAAEYHLVITSPTGQIIKPIIEGNIHIYQTEEFGEFTLTFSGIEGCETSREVAFAPQINEIEVSNITYCADREAMQNGAVPSCDGAIIFEIPGIGLDIDVQIIGPSGERIENLIVEGNVYTVENICESGSYCVSIVDEFNCENVRYFEVCCCIKLIEDRNVPKGELEYKAVNGDCYDGIKRLSRIDEDISHVYVTGVNDGAIDVTTVGGLPDKNYLWTGPNNYSSSREDIYGLVPGEYCVTVTEDLDCSQDEISECFEVRDCPNNRITVTKTITNTYRGCNIGTAILSPSQGIPPYRYYWPGEGISPHHDKYKLSAGDYTVTVVDEDGNGCEKVVEFKINEEDLPLRTSRHDNTCKDLAYGRIEVNLIRSNLPVELRQGDFLWQWSNGESDVNDRRSSIIRIAAGDYSLTVTHNIIGCYGIYNWTINEDNPIVGESYPPDDCIEWTYCNGARVEQSIYSDITEYDPEDCRYKIHQCWNGHEAWFYYPEGLANGYRIRQPTYIDFDFTFCDAQERCGNGYDYGPPIDGTIENDVHFHDWSEEHDCAYCFSADICTILDEQHVIPGSIHSFLSSEVVTNSAVCNIMDSTSCEYNFYCDLASSNDPWMTRCVDSCNQAGTPFDCDMDVLIMVGESLMEDVNAFGRYSNEFVSEQDLNLSLDYPKLNMKIYPSLYTDLLILEADLDRKLKFSFTMYNMEGKQVFYKDVFMGVGKNIINISDSAIIQLSSGTYIVKLYNREKNYELTSLVVKADKP